MKRSWVGRLARFGLACRGVVYLVIALLALNVARGHSSGQADSRGALETISHHRFGHILVLAIGIGFAGLAVWQTVLAAHPPPGWTGNRTRRRLGAAGKALIDAALCVSALAIATRHRTTSGGDKQAVDVTARVMRHAAGRWVVGAVGIAIGIAGVSLIVKGLRKRYDVEVRIYDVPASFRRAFEAVGELGMLARGAIVVLLGYFVVQAAITFDPSRAKGLDGVLASLVHDRWGPLLLTAIAVGLGCFGVFSLLEARYART